MNILITILGWITLITTMAIMIILFVLYGKKLLDDIIHGQAKELADEMFNEYVESIQGEIKETIDRKSKILAEKMFADYVHNTTYKVNTSYQICIEDYINETRRSIRSSRNSDSNDSSDIHKSA